MALVSEIIRDAYRESNLISITESPNQDEQSEGLRLLNRHIQSVLGYEAGDKFELINIGERGLVTPKDYNLIDYDFPNYLPLNARLLVNISTPTSVYLNPNPNDGSRFSVVDVGGNFNTNNLTVVGNGKNIEGAAQITLGTASTRKDWFYRADLGNWMAVSDIAIADELPFPTKFEDMFVIGLASRINPRNGVTLDEQSMMHYRRQMNMFRAQYSQIIPQRSEEGLIRTTRMYRYEGFDGG